MMQIAAPGVHMAALPFLARRLPELGNTFLNFNGDTKDHDDAAVNVTKSMRRTRSSPSFLQCSERALINQEECIKTDMPHLIGKRRSSVCTDVSTDAESPMVVNMTDAESDMSSRSVGAASASLSDFTDSEATEKPTTVMLQNLPRFFSQLDLMSALADAGMAEAYDFCYMPVAFQNGSSRGYAFINFTEPNDAMKLIVAWNGSRHLCSRLHKKPLLATFSSIQGFDALVAQPQMKKLFRIRNPSFRPFIRRQEA